MAPFPLLEKYYRTIASEYQGDRARTWCAQLWEHNRRITNPAYEKGVRLAASVMRGIGLDDVKVHSYPVDGKRLYGNWLSRPWWNVTTAWLELKVNGRWQRFCDYQKIPTSVFVYAAPTNGTVTTRLVSENSRPVKGNLVFCRPTDDNRLRVTRRGGAGIVSDFSPNWPGVREADDFQDAHRWENACLAEDRSGLAGFMLSRRQGQIVRSLLDHNGAVDCRFRIQGRLGQGRLLCATGCIRGKDDPDTEVVVPAHLYEAGANDNASGVAGALEAMRTLHRLIRAKKLEPPRFTVRVLFTFEIVGFLAYFESQKNSGKRYIGGVNPDMIGEDQKKCQSTLNIYQTPDSVSSFCDPLLIHLTTRAAGKTLRYKVKKFIVNDNSITDPAVGVPCPALIHLRDKYYHSNEDSPDKVSALTLKKVGSAMAAFLYAAAALDPDSGREIALLCINHAASRFLAEAEKGMSPDRAAYLLDCEKERLAGIERHTRLNLRVDKERLERLLATVRLKKDTHPVPAASDIQKAERLVPERTVMGPVTLEHVPYAKRKNLPFQPSWSSKWNLPLFWADGKRSLFEIYQRARHETGPYDLKTFIRYFRFLEKHGLIVLKV